MSVSFHLKLNVASFSVESLAALRTAWDSGGLIWVFTLISNFHRLAPFEDLRSILFGQRVRAECAKNMIMYVST
jgi:hypothetical protein